MTDQFTHKCKRCGYEWLGKLENPKTCPKCNSPYWNKERTKYKRTIIVDPDDPYLITENVSHTHFLGVSKKAIMIEYYGKLAYRALEDIKKDEIFYAEIPITADMEKIT